MGAFCEMYGNSMRMKVLEYLLENDLIDFPIGNMAKELKISRPKAYQIMEEFLKKDYVKKTRIFGKTQLYQINKDNKRVKIFLRDFMEVLRLVVEEYEEKEPEIAGNVRKTNAVQVR